MRSRTSLLALTIFVLIGCADESAAPSKGSAADTDSSTEPPVLEDAEMKVASSDPETEESGKAGSVIAEQDATTEQVEHRAPAEQGEGHVDGHGPGRGMGRGRGMGGGFRPDMNTIHTMFAGRDKIKRTVTALPHGAQALTESDDAEIAGLIQEHVPAMESRIHEQDPLPPMTFHPVFMELAKHSDDYTLDYEETEKGIKVTYEAADPFVIMLVQEHAKLVSRFIKNGMQEIHTPYQFPKLPEGNLPEADEGRVVEEKE